MWTIKQIFDGDYGCEELAPGESPKVTVTLTDEQGNERYESVADAWLIERQLDVGSVWKEKNMDYISRDKAFELLKKYNKDPFHIQHALTVEAVMKWYAKEQGYEEDAEYWGIVGLLHDIDFELYPDEHCLKAPELLREAGVGEDIIHAVCSHGYGIIVGNGTTIDVEPFHEMEKILFAADELTGLIWSASLMRPSKSTKDMELKSLKKKYKSNGFAAGCSREVIARGAEQLGWELDELLSRTLQAMAATEDEINAQMEAEFPKKDE